MALVWRCEKVWRKGSYSRGGRGDGGEEEARAVRGALRQGKETGPGASDGAVAVVAGAVAGLNNGGGREGDKGQSSDELHGGRFGMGGIKEDVVGPVVYFSQGGEEVLAGRWTSLLQAGVGSILYPPGLPVRPGLAVTSSHASSQERLAAPMAPHQGESGR